MRVLGFLALTVLFSANAFAVPIHWNTWASASSGSATVGSTTVAVAFDTTNSHASIANYPSWSPSSTFADGVVVGSRAIEVAEDGPDALRYYVLGLRAAIDASVPA